MNEVDQPEHIRAHAHSIRNREEVLASERCGCFYCCSRFAPAEIQEWVDERKGGEQTALCPKCGIDSVIGSASGYPTSRVFLERMKAYWF